MELSRESMLAMEPRRRERGLSRAVRRAREPRTIAVGLAWFGIGLGVAELLVPRAFGRAIGVRKPSKAWIRAFGLREIASGVGILARRNAAPFLWARVAGDVIDLASLAAATRTKKARPKRLAAAAIAASGVAALDVVASRAHGTARRARGEDAYRIHDSIAINRPLEELFAFWRDFENLPGIMSHIQSVQSTTERRSHWRANTSDGSPIEWDTELVLEAPNEKIQWRSVEGSKLSHEGLVVFQALPGGRGTLIKLDLSYRPAHAKIARNLMRLFGASPEQQLHQDLRRFKQRIEAGEVATTQGQPAGRRSLLSRRLP